MDTAPIANFWGFFALASYIATLLPSILRIVFPTTRKNSATKKMLKYRRQIGLLAFTFCFIHGFLLVEKRNIDFFDLQTYHIYIQGIATFIIFALLAISSNNWSTKKLRKNWKKLHSLTYLAMFLLLWHVWDKMYAHWSYLTPAALFGLIAVILLFIYRKKVEYLHK